MSGGHWRMRLEQLHACVNQIPGEESGLRLLHDMKRETVIGVVWWSLVRT